MSEIKFFELDENDFPQLHAAEKSHIIASNDKTIYLGINSRKCNIVGITLDGKIEVEVEGMGDRFYLERSDLRIV